MKRNPSASEGGPADRRLVSLLMRSSVGAEEDEVTAHRPNLHNIGGHQPSGQLAGVATSIFALGGPNGNVLFPLFDRPGVGLDSQTTWCWWFDQAQGAWIGADILIHPNFR